MSLYQRNAAAHQDRADAMFSNVLNEYHTGMDANIFLLEPEDRQRAAFQNIDNAQKASGAVLWTTEEALREVESKLDSPRPGLAQAARNAMAQIQQMVTENRLVVYRAASDSARRRRFADATFLARLVENAPEVPIALITLDSDLAASAMNLKLNIEPSVRHKPIAVYRVNGVGNLAWFNFIRTAEGRYVNPRNSLLHVENGVPVSRMDSSQQPLPAMDEGDQLFTPDGRAYCLGEELNSGGEATIFKIEGNPDHLIKVFSQYSERKTAKCRLLARAAASFPCPGAVLPQELLYDDQGVFRGYVMPKVNGVELTRLFTYRGQQNYASFWNRSHYARLAATIADMMRDFSLAGLHIGDVAPANILVGYGDSGTLSPEKVFFIDLDSAQFGSAETGIFPPDGLTPEYAAPEYLHQGVDVDELRSAGSMVFSASLLCLQTIMCGVHPFRKTILEEGQTLNVAQSIADSAFPYSAGADSRKAISPDGADKLWSNLSSDTKRFFYDLFQRGGATNAVNQRPSFFGLSRVLNGYANWIQRPETQRRYPEALSLMPQALKPFYARCAHYGCKTPDAEFAVTSFRSDGRYFCPDCQERIRRNRRPAEPAPAAPAPIPAAAPAPAAAPEPRAAAASGTFVQSKPAAKKPPVAPQPPQSAVKRWLSQLLGF